MRFHLQIMNCTSLGTIGENIVTEGMSGGLLGLYGKNTADIINDASLMKIKSKEYSGGIVGRVLNDNAVCECRELSFCRKCFIGNEDRGHFCTVLKIIKAKCYAVQTAGDLFSDSMER